MENLEAVYLLVMTRSRTLIWEPVEGRLLQQGQVVQLVKNPSAIWGDLGSIPGLGRNPGEGKGYPLQYSGLENSMDYIFHGQRVRHD